MKPVEDVYDLEAGPQMDTLIFEWVFAKSVKRDLEDPIYLDWDKHGYDPAFRDTHVPHYSTDIAAAWEVVEKLGITVRPVGSTWWAAVMQGNDPGMWGRAPTAPLAICKAALRAVYEISPFNQDKEST